MSRPKAPSDADLCQRCGHPRRKHWSLNFSDGQQVSGEVLVCPTAIFQSKTEVADVCVPPP